MKKLLTTLIVFSLASVCSAGWWGGTSLNSSTDANVRDINVGGSLRGRTGNIVKVDTNGITTPYIESADTAVARGTAYVAALASAQAGDKIYISGDFNFGTSQVVGPNDIKIYGGGNASMTFNYVGAIQYLAKSGTVFDGITFYLPAGAKYITPLGRVDFSNCEFYSDLDCLYQYYPGSSLYLYHCNFHSNYDCHNSITTCYLYADDCNFVSESNDADTAGSLRAMAGSSGGTLTVDIRNSRLIARNLETSGTPTEVLGAYVNTGTITLRNCTVQAVSTRTPAIKYDVQAATGSSIIASNTNGSGTNGSLITSGTITYADNGRFQQTLNYAANAFTSSNTFTGDVNITPSAERGLVIGSVPTPLATGTVDINNFKLSLVDANSFVDFNTATVLTGQLGKYIIIKDSSGYTVGGKILAAGSGETYAVSLPANGTFDANYTGWTVSDYSSLSIRPQGQDVCCVRLAHTAGLSNRQYLYRAVTNPFSLIVPVRVSADVNNGTGPAKDTPVAYYITAADINTGGMTSSTWTKSGYLYRNAPASGINVFLVRDSATDGNMLWDNAEVNQITTPSATGVTIEKWKINSSFNGSDTAGYTYAIYDRPIGDMHVSGLADFNDLTVTGKIILTPTTAPTKTASAPTFSKFYGGDSNALGDPCTWIAVDANVGGTIKTLYMPLYGQP